MGLAQVIALNHKPDPESGPMLMHQFLMRGSDLAYNDIPDNTNEELTRAEIDSIEARRRAEGDLGHAIDDTDDVHDLHIERSGFVEDGINHHVFGYSVKETGFEQNSAAADNHSGDDNTVTATGRLKMGIQDDAYAQAERKRNERAYRQLTQAEILRQQLLDLNRRIESLEKRAAQIDDNISKLREAREILADSELNADTDRGRELRQRLGQLNTDLHAQGVDIGVQTDADGRVLNADEARNNAANAQAEQEAEAARVDRELQDVREQRNELLRSNPELRDERAAYFDDVAESRTTEEVAAFDARVENINDISTPANGALMFASLDGPAAEADAPAFQTVAFDDGADPFAESPAQFAMADDNPFGSDLGSGNPFGTELAVGDDSPFGTQLASISPDDMGVSETVGVTPEWQAGSFSGATENAVITAQFEAAASGVTQPVQVAAVAAPADTLDASGAPAEQQQYQVRAAAVV